MQTEFHTTPALFDDLAAEWNTLLPPNRSDLLFSHAALQRLWWQYKGEGDLCILTIRDADGALRGIAPFYIHESVKGRTLCLLGCRDILDYLDLIITPGHEDSVTGFLLETLLSADAPEWDKLAICNLHQDSPSLALLPELASARGLTAETVQDTVCPVLALPESYEAYLAGMSKKQRHEMRRKRRRAEGYDMAWYLVGEEHDVEAEIETFLELMALTPEKAEFLKEPGHVDFFRASGKAMYEQGLLDLIFLTFDGRPAAAMWQHAYQDRMLLYNSAFDLDEFYSLSPGIVLLGISIENAIERGLKYYDFMRGDEPYKYDMGAVDTPLRSVIITRQGY